MPAKIGSSFMISGITLKSEWTGVDGKFCRQIGTPFRGSHKRYFAVYECCCGTIFCTCIPEVKCGNTSSCGCYAMAVRSRPSESDHGESSGPKASSEYRAWAAMKKSRQRHASGERICVCDRWRNSYLNFLADMGRKPSSLHLLARIDEAAGYAPSNCKWLTRQDLARLRPKAGLITAFGESKIETDWIKDPRCNLSMGSIRRRLASGMSPEEAIFKPTKASSKKLSILPFTYKKRTSLYVQENFPDVTLSVGGFVQIGPAIKIGGSQARPLAVFKCKCGIIECRRADYIAKRSSASCLNCRRMLGEEPQRTDSFEPCKPGSERPCYYAMKDRCLNPNSVGYHRYGGRGIVVCDRWLNSYEAFLSDMGPRPSREHTIDRIDNDGNYEPGNCRWATRIQQANNKSSNFVVFAFGKSKTLSEWSRDPMAKVRRNTIFTRIYNGVPPELAISLPPQTLNGVKARTASYFALRAEEAKK